MHQSEIEGKLKNEIETSLAGLTKIETEKRREQRLASNSSFDSGRYSLPSSIIRDKHINKRKGFDSSQFNNK